MQDMEHDDQTMASLSPQALHTCLIGRNRIAHAVSESIFFFFWIFYCHATNYMHLRDKQV